jgi:hypothetical protein
MKREQVRSQKPTGLALFPHIIVDENHFQEILFQLSNEPSDYSEL